jgi:myo-inositol 2-dehydrogenase / D-chiro-inositol 1-dehydrogenase
MKARDELRAGMISWAHIHAEFRAKALSEIPGTRIVAIADDNEARGRDAAKRFQVENFYTDWRKLIERDDLDVVFIHSENNRHAEQAIAVAQTGKDIFCEKPMTTTLEDADRMLEAVKKANVQLTVAFVSRFGQEADRAKKIVDTGILGNIVSARAIIGLAGVQEIGCPPDMAAWIEDPVKGGGGAWADEGTHVVDLLRWMVGDVGCVSAVTNKLVKKHLGVEDQAIALLQFRNGALGEVNASWSLAIDVGMRNTIELYGSKGTLFVELTSKAPKVEVYTTSLAPELSGWVNPHIVPAVTEPHDYKSWPPHVHHYKREVASFVNRYFKGLLPYGPTGEDGRAVVEVILAGYESARTGRVVNLPLKV